jgi:fibronectin type 3 domain-containing protein
MDTIDANRSSCGHAPNEGESPINVQPNRSRIAAARILVLAAVVAVSLWAAGAPRAYAATYRSDLILSDANMRASYSMTRPDIQAFLKTQTGVLKSLVTTSASGETTSATAIIYEASQNFRISPRVLLALLQKEQSLLTRTTLKASTLSRATGAGCINDTTNYYPGFGRQVWYAAWLLSNFGEVKAFPSSFVSLWIPGMTCSAGDVVVTPANLATYKLYVYNPSISGNANFWSIYNNYFGNPAAGFVPAKASSLSAASAGYSSVRLGWKTVTAATGYETWRATSSVGTYSKIATSTSTESTATRLTAGRTYYFKVRAYRTEDTATAFGPFSDVKIAKPVPGKASLAAASAGYTSVKLSWTAVPGATRYEVYRATSSKGTYAKVSTPTGIGYADTGRTTGRTYYYKVRAYHLEGSTKVYGGFSSIRSAKPVPVKVTGLTVAAASATSLSVKWSRVSGATKYEVYRSTSATGAYAKVTTASGTSFTNTGLIVGRTYNYRVRAYHLQGSTKVYGSFSAVVPATM